MIRIKKQSKLMIYQHKISMMMINNKFQEIDHNNRKHLMQ